MRTDIAAGVLNLQALGKFDAHYWYRVQNRDGTYIDLSHRLKSVKFTLPGPGQPIASCTIELWRENKSVNPVTESLSPMMAGSTYNIDPTPTPAYAPLLQLGARFILSVVYTSVGAARPATSAFHEVIRGRITDTDFAGRRGSAAVTVIHNDQSGELQLRKSEQAFTYAAGTTIGAAIQQVLTNHGYGALQYWEPTAITNVLGSNYAPGLQGTVWEQIWALAQSIGRVVWWRYKPDGTPALTLFTPARNKVTSDFTHNHIEDVPSIGLSEREITNVLYGQFTNLSGQRENVGPFEDTDSIDKYGGVRRAGWLIEAEDSITRTPEAITAMLLEALPDVADPDVLASYIVPGFPWAEISVDMHTFPADYEHYDSAQLLAPYSISYEHAGRDQLPLSTIAVRGKPTAGAAAWPVVPAPSGGVPQDSPDYYQIYDLREVPPVVPGNRRWVWEQGSGVARAWVGYAKLDIPPNQDIPADLWRTQVNPTVLPLSPGQQYYEINAANLPDIDEQGGLQIEPHLADSSLSPLSHVWRIPVRPAIPQGPRISIRPVIHTDGTLVDVFATGVSEYENVRIHVRTSAGVDYSLVLGSNDPGPLYVPSGTEVGPTHWFLNNTTFAITNALNDIPLVKEHLGYVLVQAEGEKTKERSAWVPVVFEHKNVPWIENAAAEWDESTNSVKLRIDAGAHTQSIIAVIARDSNFTDVVGQNVANLADGQVYVMSQVITAADRNKLLYWRVQVFNGALSGGSPTGLQGVPVTGNVMVEAAPPPIAVMRDFDGSSRLYRDLSLTVNTPVGAGDLTVKIWTNKASTSHPNPNSAPDVTVTIPSNSIFPFVVDESLDSDLNDVLVWPGQGKPVYYQVTSAEGGDTGVVTYRLTSAWGLQNADGTTVNDAITVPSQIAIGMRPPRFVTTRPGTGLYVGDIVGAQDTNLAWEWTSPGGWVPANPTHGYLPFIRANSITAVQVAAAQIYTSHLNIADLYLEGMTFHANNPGAGSIAWTGGAVRYQGMEYSIGTGNTSNEVVWWKRSAPTVFQTSSSNGLEGAGFNQNDGDVIIALNEGGSPIVVWNGTRIYGGHIATNAIKARHIDVLTIEVGKYIQSTGYTSGSVGWKIQGNGDAEFNNVTIRGSAVVGGSLNAVGGTFQGEVKIGGTAGGSMKFYNSSNTYIGEWRFDNVNGYVELVTGGGSTIYRFGAYPFDTLTVPRLTATGSVRSDILLYTGSGTFPTDLPRVALGTNARLHFLNGPWDIYSNASNGNRLEFYYNGTLRYYFDNAGNFGYDVSAAAF